MKPLTSQDRAEIRAAYRAGTLRTQAVDPSTGAVALHPVTAVLRHSTPTRPLVRIVLEDGRPVTCTEDHSVFVRAGAGVAPIRAEAITSGTRLVTVVGGQLATEPVRALERLPPHPYTYDLSVPGPQNFVLTNGVLAHNSYSIGGISLDIERSSKYESLKQNAESQFDKAAEAKTQTVRYMRGLQQSKYGVGVRSAWGPAVGRGILSPRNFL
jgi:hypothetical protein